MASVVDMLDEVEDELNDIKRLLENRKFVELNRAILDDKNSERLLKSGWDLVPLICSLVVDRGFIEACANTIKNLATVGNPKELLVALLEQMELLDADIKFQMLLGAMQTVLVRLMDRDADGSMAGYKQQQQCLRWVLGALDKHIMKDLPAPKSHGLEGKARLLQDSDPDAMRIENAMQDLIQFCEPFLRRLPRTDDAKLPVGARSQRELLSGFLVQILHPLAQVDIDVPDGIPKGTLRIYAEKIVSDLCLLENNFYVFYERSRAGDGRGPTRYSDTFDGSVSLQALGTLLYVVHVEGHRKECLPCIYSHHRTFIRSLPAILDLLGIGGIGSNDDCRWKIEKGLRLVDQLLRFVQYKELNEELLDLPSLTELVLCFERIAVFEKSLEIRRLAIKQLPILINKFNDAGRYKFVYTLLNAFKHSGVKSIVVGTFKGHVHEQLQQQQHKPVPLLIGHSLHKMLNVIASLPQGVETDLVDDSERILAALNLLRFLFLIDVKANVTGVWDVRDAMRNEFLDVLVKALEISRAHYQLELKHQSEEEMGARRKGSSGFQAANISVDGLELPQMPRKETINWLKSALTRLDMIHGVVVRVLEIMDGKK